MPYVERPPASPALKQGGAVPSAFVEPFFAKAKARKEDTMRKLLAYVLTRRRSFMA